MIFALSILPVFGVAALAFDYSNVVKQRNAVQASLDAAALATAKQYAQGTSTGQLKSYSREFFDANLPSNIDAERIEIDLNFVSREATDSDGQPYTQKAIRLDAIFDYDTMIAPVVGHQVIENNIVSEVAMGNITVEVALVIDNSGSMASNNRLKTAQKTSKDLVDSIFHGAGASNKRDPVKFAIVPFAASVNVGSDYRDADWMDNKGWSPVHNENLDWDTYVAPADQEDWEKIDVGTHAVYREKIDGNWSWKSRFDIYDMLDTDWAGCVEMRPWPHNTLDSFQLTNTSFNAVRSGHGGGSGLEALFVPMFAPAEPYYEYAEERGGGWGWGRGRGRGRGRDRDDDVEHRSDWYNYPNDYLYDWYRPEPARPWQLEQLTKDDDFQSPYDDGVTDSRQNLRQDWVWRYQAAALDRDVIVKDIRDSDYGPNVSCTTGPLLPLTTNRGQVKSHIARMKANGNTNIQQGLTWGWRVLSSRAPFDEGRRESDGNNRKYIILLTDGNNTYGSSYTPNETTYAAWGYGKHGRMEEGTGFSDLPDLYRGDNINSDEERMNVHTLQSCQNARKDGVTIFTIAFDVRDGSSVKELLDECAGPGISGDGPVASHGVYYFDVEGEELQTAMSMIASQISDMRLSK